MPKKTGAVDGLKVFMTVVGLLVAFVVLTKIYRGILWVIGMIKLGVITLANFTLLVLGLVLLAFLIALICDAFAPFLRKIRKNKTQRRAVANSRLPSLYSFRTGRSNLDGGAGNVERFMATLLREHYKQMTGYLPDTNTFLNNEGAYSTFKAGELPKALFGAKAAVDQQLFAPLIAGYRTAKNCEKVSEA